MRLRSLMMENWMSYKGRHSREFSTGLTMVYGQNLDRPTKGSNASGKSGLLLAIYYSIRGKLPMKSKISGLVHDGEKQATLHLFLEDEDTTLEIYRTIGGRGQEFWWEASDLPQRVEGDKGATQKELDEYLGLTNDFFDSIIFLSPNSDFKPLRGQSGTKVMEMMSNFIDVTPWEVGAQNALKEINHHTALRDRLLGESATYRRLQEKELAELSTLNINLLQERRRLKERGDQQQAKTEGLQKQILEIQLRLREKPEGDETELKGQLAAIRTEVENMHKAQGRLSHIIQRKNLGAGAWCPTCHQTVSEQHSHLMEQEREQARAQLKDFNDRYGELGRRQTELQQRLTLVQNWVATEQALQAQIQNLQTQAFAIREQIDSGSVTVIERDIEAAKDRIEEYQQEMQSKDLEVSRLNQHIPVLKKLREGFTKGIRNMLLDDIRSQVSYYSDLYTGYLCPEGLRVEHVSETSSGRDTWDIQVYKHDQPRALPSGGEGLLVDLAQSLAIRDVLIAQHGCKLDFLLLDDYFGQLDKEHCMKVSDLLLTEIGGSRIANIMIASPIDHGIAGNQDIYVTKQGGKSTMGDN